MTLKAFHVLFVLLSTLMSLLFGVWSLARSSETVFLMLGGLSLAMAVALLIYGGWFLRKMKDVSYL